MALWEAGFVSIPKIYEKRFERVYIASDNFIRKFDEAFISLNNVHH
jgi:hypothetical protein